MPKKIDLTGQKFGKLTVLKEAPRENTKQPIKWICECECGNQVQVRTTDLRNGHSSSCGKCRQRKINMLGQRFGKLVVIKELPSNSKGNAMWECQCDCGNVITTEGIRLRNGQTTSCGCTRINKLILQNQQRALNLQGQQFGELIAIEPTEQRQNGQIMWLCQCSCGRSLLISSHNLISGNTCSCGCNKMSHGEIKIEKILQTANIGFETQKQFPNLKFDNGYFARFDFYLPDYNTIIEYDGRQHFIEGSGVFDNPTKFALTQEHDKIKNAYCKQHGINLIRIPFTHYDSIILDDLLPDTSNFIV